LSPKGKYQSISWRELAGIPWTSDRWEAAWQMSFDELVRFQQEHGQIQVTKKDTSNMFEWIKYQQ
jgi:hypothetical protein